MFEREIRLNQFLMGGLEQIAEDIPTERLGERAPGNGHPPIWVLGHLEICAEMGQQYFGAEIRHPDWVQQFGPGSSDEMTNVEPFDTGELVRLIQQEYSQLCEMASGADAEAMSRPHGIALLENSNLQDCGDVVSHLLSSHFGFHLAQLSAWRRAAGHGPLF